jgi:malate synthase
MKLWNILVSVGSIGLAAVLGVVMANTNPSQGAYEEYAVKQLTSYLKKDVCNQTTKLIEKLINTNCDKLIDSANPQMRQLLALTTERQDLFLFSVYRTELKVNQWIPSYRFETVGAFNNFYTYTAEQQ